MGGGGGYCAKAVSPAVVQLFVSGVRSGSWLVVGVYAPVNRYITSVRLKSGKRRGSGWWGGGEPCSCTFVCFSAAYTPSNTESVSQIFVDSFTHCHAEIEVID